MKPGKAGKPGPAGVKNPPGKTRRKKTTAVQRLLLVLFGLAVLGLLEVALRLLPAAVEPPAESDPFVGFSAIHPLFVPDLAEDGSLRMKTAPGKLRWFNPQDFAAEKEPGTFRIFTLGGSTTYGRPYKDATSFSGWLRKLLSRPGGSPVRYEVINAGGISYASYRVVVILEELLNYQPDLFIIYTGHNEFLETRTYGDFLERPETMFRVSEALSRLKTYRLLARAYQHVRTGSGESPGAEGTHGASLLAPEVQTILDRSAGLELYRRDTLFSHGVFEHFHYNLARMKRLCREAGVPVLFLEPVDNIKDFSPFKSQSRPDLDSRSRERLMMAVAEGFGLMDRGRAGEGIERFREAAALDPLSADCSFYLGRAYLEAGDTASAVKNLLKARELDVCPLRAQEPIHRILRQETAGVDDPDLLLLPDLFRQLSPGGIIGREMLVDHIHPLPEGHLQIALAVLTWMGEEGFVQKPSLPDSLELRALFWEVMDSLPPEYFRQGIINLAKVLIWAKKYPEALSVLDSRWKDLEQEGEAQYLAGSALLETGSGREAVEHFRKALELAPGHIMVLSKLGPLYAQLGEADSSIAVFEKALELYPDNPALLSDYGIMLSRLGRKDKALQLLLQAQRLEPELAGLDNNLGTVYAMAENYTQAVEAFRRAIHRMPEDPEPYYNLGNVYAVMKRSEEAEQCFSKTIRINPSHAGALINLGNIYQSTGRYGLAEEQFSRAIQTSPQLAAPYLNLAALYRSTGRSDAALQVLKLGMQRFPGDTTFKDMADELQGR
ncbi:MAG: tetratricopeptide repeat protein [Candidatus Glassbacteria bacterium]|nr:tetratricopeptide repeat protein [Candidatus Glassbacteria bacterium]